MPALKDLYDIDKKTGCWIFKRSTCRNGYGQIHVKEGGKYKRYRAHRYFFKQYNGYLPDCKKTHRIIHHICHNKICVNPDHLEDISTQDNTVDGCGKLSDRDVYDINKLYFVENVTQPVIASLFNINQCHVSRIVNALRRS